MFENRAGYTLLEVTVALVIVGISITVLFGQLSKAKTLSIKSDLMIDSVRIIKNLVENEEVVNDALNKGGAEGEVPDEAGWIYNITTEPMEIANETDGDPLEIEGFQKVTICVSNPNGKRSYCITRWDLGK